MQLLAPKIGLLGWTLLSLLSLVLLVIALISVLKNNYPDPKTKLIWLLVIIFVPTVGSILFLTIGRQKTSNKQFNKTIERNAAVK